MKYKWVMPKPTPLSPAQITDFVAAHPGWLAEHGPLTRTWEFSTFPHALRFVNKVAELAEAADHHPDIDIRWKKITLAFVTHDAGNAVTALDTRLANECELVAKTTS
jgi:4a-hydroxytetrahydrobiopterin dehydratase